MHDALDGLVTHQPVVDSASRLEDAEMLLHGGGAGRGMAALLNLCDGLLGQGLRCLSRLEFGRLPAAQAARMLGRPVAGPMTLAEVFGTAPVSVEAEKVSIGQYL